jgi:hypothetical protein
MTYNNLPIYQAIVDFDDNNTGMICISLVDEPAVEADFLAFDKDNQPLQFKVENEEQRMVFGLVMAADMPIYRRTDDGYEYYITFSKETIRTMAEKYFKEDKQNNVDTQHNFKLEDGVTMVQMFIKDSDNGINPVGFEGYKDGSLFAQFHIENDDVWESIKEGTYKGFSLAGNFNLEKMNINKPIEDTKTMSKLNRVKEMLKAMLQVFGDVATDKGTLMYDGDEEIKEGDAVKLLDGEGNEVDAEDGDYRTEDKRIIVVKEGKVAEIKDVEEEEPENSEETPAEDAPEEDVNASAEPEDSKMKQAFVAMAEATNETYDEKYRKIYAAIYDKGYEYAYVVEASDDYAIISSWGEDELEHYFKFDLTWDEEGNVSVSDPVEVKRTYVPIDEEPEQEEEKPAEEPENEEPAEEEASKNEPAALSAQEEFAKLDGGKKVSSNKRVEELRKRGYKINM